MNRKLIDVIFILVYAVIIILVLYLKPDFLGFKSWIRSVWIIIGLVLFPVLYYFTVRIIFNEAFPVRLQIKPFLPLTTDTFYNGVAIAKLLELEMQPTNTGQKAQSKVRTGQESRPINISVAGTTIPLEFLWSKIDQLLFGRIYTINGIISEVLKQQQEGNQEIRIGKVVLEAWSSKTIYRWKAESSPFLICDPLQTAIKYLADNIRSSFRYYQELADKYEAQMRYDQAIRYGERISRSISLPYLYLLDGQVDKAANRFEELLDDEDMSNSRADLIRGKALVKTAMGEYSDAQSLLSEAHSLLIQTDETYIRCKLDSISILRYQGELENALQELGEVLPLLEANLNETMGFDLKQLIKETFGHKYENLKDKDKIKVFTNLLDLNESLCAIGRCARDQGDIKSSEKYFEQAIEIQNVLLDLGGEFYQQALGIGVLMEDLGRYDEAIEWYRLSFNDSEYLFKDDPEDISVLTNLGWSTAGLLACYIKKIRFEFISFGIDGKILQESYEEILNDGYELSLLLRSIPDVSFQVVQNQIIELYNKGEDSTITNIESLDEKSVAKIFKLLTDLKEKTHEDNIQYLLDFANWYIHKDVYERLTQEYFRELLNRPGNFPHGEGYFGLACIEATSYRIENAFIFLRAAITIMPELRNRARLDEDFSEFRELEEFIEIVSWDDELSSKNKLE